MQCAFSKLWESVLFIVHSRPLRAGGTHFERLSRSTKGARLEHRGADQGWDGRDRAKWDASPGRTGGEAGDAFVGVVGASGPD